MSSSITNKIMFVGAVAGLAVAEYFLQDLLDISKLKNAEAFGFIMGAGVVGALSGAATGYMLSMIGQIIKNACQSKKVQPSPQDKELQMQDPETVGL